MADFINTIDTLGDDAVVDSIIQRTITEFRDNVVTALRSGCFRECRSLSVVDTPCINVIGQNAFGNCIALTALILRSSKICTLQSTNALDGSGIRSGTGYIYVPRALLSDDDKTKDYRRATNWSTVAAQFRALEDYTVDGTITGELDETKIAA